MLNEKSEIGRIATVPYHIATAKISSRARNLWTILALYATPDQPEVALRLGSMAEELDCSVDSVLRALRELINFQLLIKTGQYYLSRYKIYRLVWNAPAYAEATAGKPEGAKRLYGIHADLPAAVLPIHGSQGCGLTLHNEPTLGTDADRPDAQMRIESTRAPGVYINNINNKINNNKNNLFINFNLNPAREAEALMAEHGEVWKKRFECLDGLSGRPTVQECVEQALNHSARHKYANVQVYLQTWLLNASKHWIQGYFREKSAAITDPALSPEAVERKLKAEQERKAKYEKQRALPERGVNPDDVVTPQELKAAFDQLRGRRPRLPVGLPAEPASQS